MEEEAGGYIVRRERSKKEEEGQVEGRWWMPGPCNANIIVNPFSNDFQPLKFLIRLPLRWNNCIRSNVLPPAERPLTKQVIT